MSPVEIKERSMSHVHFKKRQCRPVDFKGQWPRKRRPRTGVGRRGGGRHLDYWPIMPDWTDEVST